MPPGWAIDVGTTNTAVARWDAAAGGPAMVEVPDVCLRVEGDDALQVPRVVPSATEVVPDGGLMGRLGRWGPLMRNAFLGGLAHIGQPALERNSGRPSPAYSPSFKRALGASPLRTLATVGGRAVSAREVARDFLRRLFAELAGDGGERPRELVLTMPVDAYEAYRAELKGITELLGVRALRFLDEPVAAAIGYGVGLEQARRVLVVDFGGGTLDLALVRVGARPSLEGTCEVVAKEGRPIGGDTVDGWLLGWACDRLGVAEDEARRCSGAAVWLSLALGEARRVKEALHLAETATFYLAPPEDLRRFEARLQGEADALDVTRDGLVALLEERGLYAALDGCLAAIDEQGRRVDLPLEEVQEVLLVGGSTLLPGVYPRLEARFGRDRVRAWQPFEAVAFGAAAFAAGHAVASDFIVHDYAFVTHDPATNERQHTVIVPRGTRFPTVPDLWKRSLVPTCPLGEPESVFKLVVSEVGRPDGVARRFSWDSAGGLHRVGGGGVGDGEPLVVPLNDADPALGRLRPPHPPGDSRPRLEVAFGVNADRWLVATVRDLWSGKRLMQQRPVVRLL